MKVVSVIRAHVGIAAVSAAVILGGAGAATAVVASSSDSDAPTQVVETTTGTAETSSQPSSGSSEASATTEVAPMQPQVAATPTEAPLTQERTEGPSATIVATVTPPQQTTTPEPETDPADTGIGTTGDDGRYTPAPVPGGAPVPLPPPVPPMQGEPGYESPTP